eukprot:2168502-Amphidinium_carterae.1
MGRGAVLHSKHAEVTKAPLHQTCACAILANDFVADHSRECERIIPTRHQPTCKPLSRRLTTLWPFYPLGKHKTT